MLALSANCIHRKLHALQKLLNQDLSDSHQPTTHESVRHPLMRIRTVRPRVVLIGHKR